MLKEENIPRYVSCFCYMAMFGLSIPALDFGQSKIL